MEYLNDMEQEGTFVYQVLVQNLHVRSLPTVSEEHCTGQVFYQGDLVAVDLIRPSRFPNSTNGPFLRLADCTGWLYTVAFGAPTMRRVDDVKTGLWVFYVDSYPHGIALRRHPVDRDTVTDVRGVGQQFGVNYHPMQNLYCDRKVMHPSSKVTYYRVQGTTGWVCDRVSTFQRHRGGGGGEDELVLLEERKVKNGLFAFAVTTTVGIHSQPTTEPNFGTGFNVVGGEIVVANRIREPRGNNGDGPFLHLTGWLGWMCASKAGVTQMKAIPVDEGCWRVRVVHKSGMPLRHQPIDDLDTKSPAFKKRDILPYLQTSKFYEFHSQVDCDRRITSATGVNFYRVKGTDGWIFDKRNGKAFLEVLLASPPQLDDDLAMPIEDGWTMEFVRGIAAPIDGLRETMHEDSKQTIIFRNEKGLKFTVYCASRTICSAYKNLKKEAIRLVRRDCTNSDLVQHLKHPVIYTDAGFKSRGQKSLPLREAVMRVPENSSNVIIDREEELRSNLLRNEAALEAVRKKRLLLLKQIKVFDDERARSSTEMMNQVEDLRRAMESAGGLLCKLDSTTKIHPRSRS
jgi:hypothetical protein